MQLFERLLQLLAQTACFDAAGAERIAEFYQQLFLECHPCFQFDQPRVDVSCG